MWFTETPWPPMVAFAVAAIACGWMWLDRRQSWWIVGAITCVALCIGTLVIERAVVTPGEQIEQQLRDLAQAVQARDEEQVLSYISLRADQLRSQLRLAFAIVTAVDSLRITDTHVTVLAAGSRAKQHFRANGTISLRDFGDIGHQPSRWRLTWQQEGGLWKVIDIQRLHPITGDPMGLLDAER